jgi:hypothetical protein
MPPIGYNNFSTALLVNDIFPQHSIDLDTCMLIRTIETKLAKIASPLTYMQTS